MIISLIAAYALDAGERKVIGLNNTIPWHSPTDMRRFKEYTTGSPIIMGRKTHESIGRVLPKRHNIIVSRQPDYKVPGADVYPSIEDAIAKVPSGASEVFIIGGGEIYQQTLARAERLYLTKINVPSIEGDSFFPEYENSDFRLIYMEETPQEVFSLLERNHRYPDPAYIVGPDLAGQGQGGGI